MKWFRHMSDASDDEFIAGIEDIFGLDGYARWWKLLEIIAKQMDGTNRCHAEYSWEKWQTLLKGKRKKLETFLEHSRKKRKISLEQNGNVLKISCPKLLTLRDEYSRKSGHTTDTAPDVVAPEAEAEEYKNLNTSPLPPSTVVDNFREKIPVPQLKGEVKKDLKNVNDFAAAAAACSRLLRKRGLSSVDTALLLGWLEHYDFNHTVLPILLEGTDKFVKANIGKVPASLSYFSDKVRERAREYG